MKKPYKERTDLEKIHSQWHKLTGLHSEEQWSAAIVRAATAAELAANFAIRSEFQSKSRLSSVFVDSLLRWANGIDGKFNRLLLPLVEGSEKNETFRELKTIAEKINKERNAIVHSGEFRDEKDASAVIGDAQKLIIRLVQVYAPSFSLPQKGRKHTTTYPRTD